ncbi:M20 aminoacylase family protein [Bradyrhizobium sp. STM 3809]|uniref:M20 aminoacylase family protein n=1 Tax=Bradyrhizobium sp. STM 3809 TaxID=551936 RepID=UPI0002409D21|nr:M20 aminoacylase family protein [Bradyrhizobium sp. STM 3809]CCE01683.1 Hippurate hydrolase (Hippuricase) (Benzoylglycine amidohydrolase) [Bradyrhizobium sp. STM 3809]
MNLSPEIVAFAADMKRIRRDIHANPEIGFQETRTSDLVAQMLSNWGIEVHRDIGETGLVGVIRGQSDGRRIGLRADMDALPMQEATGLPYSSRNANAFHGCGHDGHTTMLLGAARYFASTRRFSGEVIAIFQPAEEGLGGARRMLSDGLFDRFPCDEIYGLHTWPNAPVGRISLKIGAAMAAADNFDIVVTGRGSHGAQPHYAIDPVMVAVSIAQALQTIVGRNLDPLKTAVLSITQIHTGSAHNVIPDTARISGTIRTFDEATRDMIAQRMTELAQSIAVGFGARSEVILDPRFRVLINSPVPSNAAIAIARDLVGPSMAEFDAEPLTGSEDFADMLQHVPGAYMLLGQGLGPSLHNPQFDFNDEVAPIGASLLARIAEARTAA